MIAFDTNVLIHASDHANSAKRAVAAELLDGLRGGVLLRRVACEFLSVSRRTLRAGVNPAASSERLETYAAVFPIVLPTAAVLKQARRLAVGQQLQHWDALIYAARLEAGVSRLYPEDLTSGAITGLEAINPTSPAPE